MGELIVVFMVLVFCIGISILVRDVLTHAKKSHLTKKSG